MINIVRKTVIFLLLVGMNAQAMKLNNEDPFLEILPRNIKLLIFSCLKDGGVKDSLKNLNQLKLCSKDWYGFIKENEDYILTKMFTLEELDELSKNIPKEEWLKYNQTTSFNDLKLNARIFVINLNIFKHNFFSKENKQGKILYDKSLNNLVIKHLQKDNKCQYEGCKNKCICIKKDPFNLNIEKFVSNKKNIFANFYDKCKCEKGAIIGDDFLINNCFSGTCKKGNCNPFLMMIELDKNALFNMHIDQIKEGSKKEKLFMLAFACSIRDSKEKFINNVLERKNNDKTFYNKLLIMVVKNCDDVETFTKVLNKRSNFLNISSYRFKENKKVDNNRQQVKSIEEIQNPDILSLALYNKKNKIALFLIENDFSFNDEVCSFLFGDHSPIKDSSWFNKNFIKYPNNYRKIIDNISNNDDTNFENIIITEKEAFKDHKTTMLIKATQHNDINLMKLLIETKHVNVNTVDDLNRSALFYAMKNGSLDAFKLLIDNGAAFNNASSSFLFGDHNILFKASYGNKKFLEQNYELIFKTLSEDSHTNFKNIVVIEKRASKDDHKTNLLIKATQANNIGLMNLFIEKNIDVNARDDLHHTALFYAIEKGSLEAVKVLLNKDATIFVLDNDGTTIYGHAKSYAKKHAKDEQRQQIFEIIKNIKNIKKKKN
jgi:ankyrin repeat protein